MLALLCLLFLLPLIVRLCIPFLLLPALLVLHGPALGLCCFCWRHCCRCRRERGLLRNYILHLGNDFFVQVIIWWALKGAVNATTASESPPASLLLRLAFRCNPTFPARLFVCKLPSRSALESAARASASSPFLCPIYELCRADRDGARVSGCQENACNSPACADGRQLEARERTKRRQPERSNPTFSILRPVARVEFTPCTASKGLQGLCASPAFPRPPRRPPSAWEPRLESRRSQ